MVRIPVSTVGLSVHWEINVKRITIKLYFSVDLSRYLSSLTWGVSSVLKFHKHLQLPPFFAHTTYLHGVILLWTVGALRTAPGLNFGYNLEYPRLSCFWKWSVLFGLSEITSVTSSPYGTADLGKAHPSCYMRSSCSESPFSRCIRRLQVGPWAWISEPVIADGRKIQS